MKSLICILALMASYAGQDPQLNQTMKLSQEGVVTVVPTSNVLAANSPWYKWQYQVDGNLTGTTNCSHAMRGSWQQVSGPFKDASCEVSGLPD